MRTENRGLSPIITIIITQLLLLTRKEWPQQRPGTCKLSLLSIPSAICGTVSCIDGTRVLET